MYLESRSDQDALLAAERALLGGALLDEWNCARLLLACAASDFADSRHRLIARAIASLAQSGARVAYSTVCARLDAERAPVSREYIRCCLREALHAVAV
jgi:replicative DNA helicase